MQEIEDKVQKDERVERQLSKLETFHWEANCKREIWKEIRDKLRKDHNRKRDLIRVMRRIDTLDQLELTCERCKKFVTETKIIKV